MQFRDNRMSAAFSLDSDAASAYSSCALEVPESTATRTTTPQPERVKSRLLEMPSQEDMGRGSLPTSRMDDDGGLAALVASLLAPQQQPQDDYYCEGNWNDLDGLQNFPDFQSYQDYHHNRAQCRREIQEYKAARQPMTPGHAREPSLKSSMTTTPLHQLGNQSDLIDCPFCQRRTVTKVKKTPSIATHAAATGLFLTTMGGAIVPYASHWKNHVSHYCQNCDRKVAQRRNGQSEMQPMATSSDHLGEISRYHTAEERWD